MGHTTRAAALAIALLGLACLWDTDTLRDEMQTQADDFDLITGQFPHHGKAYYEARLRRNLEALKGDPSRREIRNDVASSYLRLSRFDEALREFEALRREMPEDYQTLSNLGVLHKKMGEFAKAADYTAQALAIKPEGHLGLGDWYLKMLHYRRDAAAPGAAPPRANFLGTPYKDFPATRVTPEDYKFVVLLIRADRTFADAVVLLGDHLHQQRHYNLALWAYLRARELGHPNPGELDRRMEIILAHWKQAFEHERRSLQSPAETVRAIQGDLKRAGAWMEAFERTEAELVGAGGTVDYETVERTMKARGLHRFRPVNRGVLTEEESRATAAAPPAPAGPPVRRSAAVPLLLLGLLFSMLLTVWCYGRSHRRVKWARGRPSRRPAIRPSGA